jgi:hypothetical protein
MTDYQADSGSETAALLRLGLEAVAMELLRSG